MPTSVDLTFTRKPPLFTTIFSALAGYSSKFNPEKLFTIITAKRDDIVPDPKQLVKFARLCRINISKKLPLIYPLTYIYPIVQIMLARKEAPLSLIKTLNTRMQIRQHRPIGIHETISLGCEFAGHRLVEKGLEVDIKSLVTISGEVVWESTITFYYRGQFGSPDPTFQSQQLEAIPDAPEIARWFLPEGVGMGFASLSGDGNPIHYWKLYARLSGFKRDFAQPLLVLTSSIAQLENNHLENGVCLDVAFKGPVYYESTVILKSQALINSTRFDIYCEGNDRPCICCSLKTCITT